MKTLYCILFIASAGLLASSCIDDYLKVSTESSATPKEVFTSQGKTDMAIMDIYYEMLYYAFSNRLWPFHGLNNDTEIHASSSSGANYEDNVAAINDLEIGRVDAVILDEVVCKYLISKKDDVFKILDDSFDEELYAVGGRLADKAFIAELDSALTKLKSNGKAKEISEKWFGQDIVK